MFKAVYPVRTFVIDHIYYRTDTPRYRVSPIDITYVVENMNDSLDVDYSEHTPNGKHNCHRHKRLARAAAYCGYRVRERKQAVKQRDRASLTDSEVKHFGRRVEKSDKRGAKT